MKISELARRGQVSKETIHCYIREGLLPKPRKLARNVADYDESYIERIRLIKELQNQKFLPPYTILVDLQRCYLRQVDQSLPHKHGSKGWF